MLQALKCLIDAANQLNFKYEFIDQNHNFLKIFTKSRVLNFLNQATPFNSEDVAKICKDKSFTYQILKESINTPRTMDFLDPNVAIEYEKYKDSNTYKEIVNKVLTNFKTPVIIKPNQKSRGVNVFKCDSYEEILSSIKIIFNKQNRDYDYLLLAQDFISTQKEFRAIIFNGSVELLYLKDQAGATFTGNLSPLHWQDSKAVYIDDKGVNLEIESFIAPIFEKLDVKYAGLDLILGPDGVWWLIEINTCPAFNYFLKHNSSELLTQMYTRILERV